MHDVPVSTDGPTIKVCLTNQGADVETPWAVDLGPAPGAPDGSRRVRLLNIPYLYGKPTWGDVIVVSPHEHNTQLTWDSNGLAYDDVIDKLLDEDGGRYMLIIDYTPHAGATAEEAFAAIQRVFEIIGEDLAESDAVVEGCFRPRNGRPGRTYLAAKYEFSPEIVIERLRAANPRCDVILAHPIADE